MISESGDTYVPPALMEDKISEKRPYKGPDSDYKRMVFLWLRIPKSIEDTIQWYEKLIREGDKKWYERQCSYHGVRTYKFQDKWFGKRACDKCRQGDMKSIDYLKILKSRVHQYCETRPKLRGLPLVKIKDIIWRCDAAIDMVESQTPYPSRFSGQTSSKKDVPPNIDHHQYIEFRQYVYRKYINSQEWFQLRQKIIRRDFDMCMACGSEANLEVHHMTYARLGNELPEDLVTLCHGCHSRIHIETP